MLGIKVVYIVHWQYPHTGRENVDLFTSIVTIQYMGSLFVYAKLFPTIFETHQYFPCCNFYTMMPCVCAHACAYMGIWF